MQSEFSRSGFIQRMALSMARWIVNSYINPIFYWILLLISLLHTEIALTEDVTYRMKTQQISESLIGYTGYPYYSEINVVVRWLDPTIYFSGNHIFFYFLSTITLITTIGVLVSLFVKFNSKYLNVSLPVHYFIKISVISTYILSYGASIMIVRSTIQMLYNQNSTQIKAVAGITLFCYTLIVYIIPLLCLPYVAWDSNHVEAYFTIPNSLMVYNISRLLFMFITFNIKYQQSYENQFPIHTLIFCIIFLPMTVFWLVNIPMVITSYNKTSKVFISAFIYFLFVRFLEIIYGSGFSALVVISGIVFFCLTGLWICEKRTFQILLYDQQKQGNRYNISLVYKLRMLCYYAKQLGTSSESQAILDRFLMEHWRICKKSQCPCHTLKENKLKEEYLGQFGSDSLKNQVNKETMFEKFHAISGFIKSSEPDKSLKNLSNFQNISQGKSDQMVTQNLKESAEISKISMRKEKKTNSKKKTTKKRQKMRLEDIIEITKYKKKWFQFIYFMIEENFPREEFLAMPNSQKKQKMTFMRKISIDKSIILANFFDRNYQSLQNNIVLRRQIEELSIFRLYFLIRYFIHEHQEQKKIIRKVDDIQMANYGAMFINAQIQLFNFRKLLYRGIEILKKFWNQLACEDPDEKKIISFIDSINKLLRKINKFYQVNFNIDTATTSTQKNEKNNLEQMPSSYQSEWKKKLKMIVDEFYLPFNIAIDEFTIDQKNPEYLLKQEQYSQLYKKEERICKILTIFDSDSKTPLCLINVNEGDSFGKIALGNIQFWEMVKYPIEKQMNVSDFLAKQFAEAHFNKMRGFLQNNISLFQPLHGFIRIGNNSVIEVNFFGLIFPDIFGDIKIALFFQPSPVHPLTFMFTKKVGLIGQTRQLDQKIEEKMSISDFQAHLKNSSILNNIQFNEKVKITVESLSMQISYFHILHNPKDKFDTIHFYELIFSDDKQGINDYNSEMNSIRDQVIETEYIEVNNIKTGFHQEEPQTQKFLLKVKEIINNDKKCKNVTIWWWLNILFFLIIVCMAIATISQVQKRMETYSRIYQQEENFSKFTFKLMEISHTLRRINIIAFQKISGVNNEVKVYEEEDQLKKIEVYKSALSEDVKKIKQYQDNFNFDWSVMVDGFDFVNRQYPQKTGMTYMVLLNKYILSSTTYLVSQDSLSMSFDYLYNEINKKIPPISVNLYNALYNNYFILLPKISSQFSQKFLVSAEKQLLWISKSTIIIMVFVMCLIILTILIYGTITIYKVNSALTNSYKLLQKVKISSIREKIERLRIYQEFALSEFNQNPSELRNYKKISSKVINRNLGLTNQNQNLADQKKFTLIPGQKSDMFDLTTRQLNIPSDFILPQNGTVNEKSIKFSEKSFSKLQANLKQDKKKYFLNFIKLLPILIFMILVFLGQYINDRRIYKIIELKFPIEIRVQQLVMIRNFMLEYSLAVPGLEDPYEPIISQMNSVLQGTFAVHKNLGDLMNPATAPLTYERYYQIRYSNYCKLLELLPKLDRPVNVDFLCTQEDLKYSNNKSLDEMLVSYLEEARILLSKAIQLSEGNSEQIRKQLYQSKSHYFQKNSVFYLLTLEYYRETMLKDYSAVIKHYKNRMIIILVFLCLVVCVVASLWMTAIKKQLYKQTSLVKTVFRLISFTRINRNNEIKKQLQQNISKFKFLA